MISQTVERDGRKFIFLKGWDEVSAPEVETVFEPVIDMILMVRPPPPGDYYLAGCAPQTSLMSAVNHDLTDSTCTCGLTGEQVQRQWLEFWSIIGLSPRDNLILYNRGAINTRVTEILNQGWSKSEALFPIAAGLAHELHHIRYHQRMMHSWRGEADAHDAQREFMDQGAPLFGIDPRFNEAWLRQSCETERSQEKEWTKSHPRSRRARKRVSPRV